MIIIQSYKIIMQQQDEGSKIYRKWNPSQLMTAINCLTYGVTCLYYDRVTEKLYKCLLSVHEQYINILHVIIDSQASFLFELQNIDSISDRDIAMAKKLKDLKYQHFIVVENSVLDNYILVMPSENEKNVIWQGLQYYIYEAKQFYSKISRFDPFKAQSMMLFLEADADGSKLLDINQCYQIFTKLKINQTKQQILNHIIQINQDLYEKQNLKKPKGFEKNLLTTVGFEYLLKYYSMKQSLTLVFHDLCPLFKSKHKQYKKSIIDILKTYHKPLMSGVQLQEFNRKYLYKDTTVEECENLIRSFPVYDGEGQQIPEEEELMSFNHFCNYIFTIENSLIDPQTAKFHDEMKKPLNEYYIYSSSNTYLSHKSINSQSKLEMYEICLKKGCRCLELDVQNKGNQIVVKHKKSKFFVELKDVLKIIKNLGFNINPFPILIKIENNCSKQVQGKLNEILENQIGDEILEFSKISSLKSLPSPYSLRHRILLMGQNQAGKKNMNIPENSFQRKLCFLNAKVDFQRKGYHPWTFSEMNPKQVMSYEEIQEKNLTDFARRGIVRSIPSEKSTELKNYDIFPMFRNGIQLISLNIQSEDIHHYILHSKFIEETNKPSGYLLKPAWIQGDCMGSMYASDFDKPALSIKLRVYAGQKLIHGKLNYDNYWLEIFLKGTAIEEQKNNKFKSQIKADGFYADFEIDCEFSVYCPDIACIVFSLTNPEGNILGARALTIKNIQEGLRTVQLIGPGMELYGNSLLLVEYSCTQVKKIQKKHSIFS